MRTGQQDAELAAQLVRLSFLVQGVYAQVAARHGLTPAQAKLMCVLAAGSRGMTDLGSALGVEKAGITGLVDRAERHGLVARSAVPGDRRSLQVALTAAGEEMARAFYAEASAAIADLAADLPPTEARALGDTLSKVNEARGTGFTLLAITGR
jgi:DNA-binding MarR family transcriptional regulator